MVKAPITNLQKDPKKVFFFSTLLMITFKLKMVFIKSVLTNNLTLVNPWKALFGLKSQKNASILLYWFAALHKTSTNRGHKTDSIYLKFSVEES